MAKVANRATGPMSPSELDNDRGALESLLRWYGAMGVDAAIDDAPHDRFQTPAEPSTVSPPRKLTTSSSAHPPQVADVVPSSADALVREAATRAAAADSIDTLREAFAAQPGLTLATSARMILAGGTPGARLMLLGAQPESDEEREAEIFAGDAGRLLDAMLRAIGLDRSGVYLAHVVPWRPPGNRPPTPLELALCLPYTRRHIALAAPAIILCLGERAAQPLLNSSEPISRLRGRWLNFEGERSAVKLLASFSPTYLLRQPLQKRRAWADLQMVTAELQS